MSSTPPATDPRKSLVLLLRQAAQVEHALACSYLYAGCSLKSTPQEFRELPDGTLNKRRALQFESARSWKMCIQTVAVEEMLHLHYVQCLLRVLGEPPCFDLPPRNPSGQWMFRDWHDLLIERSPQAAAPVLVGTDPLTADTIRRFVAYEAADMLQDQGLFGDAMLPMLSALQDGEIAFHIEGMLLGIANTDLASALRTKLRDVYVTASLVAAKDAGSLTPNPMATLAPASTPGVSTFQSISDLYLDGILPLYHQAYESGWVKHWNRALDDELLDPNYGGSMGGRLVPIGPVDSPNRFGRFLQKSIANPLKHFKDVDSIIHMIVEEGEGAGQDFVKKALAQIELERDPGAIQAYLKAMLAAGSGALPANVEQGEMLRGSHLYRFAMVMMELAQEKLRAEKSGGSFEACREPLNLADHPALAHLGEEAVAHFNACYLVVIAWMSRVYEIREWKQDMAQRKAIEMMGSWTLMSLAIRPFLEMISFLPVSRANLFSAEGAALPSTPDYARLLANQYASPERSEIVNREMDHLAVRVLSSVASWACSRQSDVESCALPPQTKQMVLTRLRALAHLNEFERQFAYRTHGGYSDRMPTLEYQQQHPGGTEYEEAPTTLSPLFENTLVLRLRFSGWGLVQLSTDPDPPSDEVGCTGTQMFHAADGDRRFDRAVLWQDFDGARAILRQPREKLPRIGVNGVDISVLVATGGATAAYVPLQTPGPAGALQTVPVQQELEMQGLSQVLTLKPKDLFGDERQLRVYLLEKNGLPPFLNGFNHLVWQDGEPVDPFILAVFADAASEGEAAAPQMLFEREVYNRGLSLMEMTPLQRLLSARGPCGWSRNLKQIPEWATTAGQRQMMLGSGYPMSYLQQRAADLGVELLKELDSSYDTPQGYDDVVSLAERLSDVSFPQPTSVAWLGVGLHYGHTLSGNMTTGSSENPILTAISRVTNLGLTIPAPPARDQPNSRWAVKYAMATMDVDALSAFVYGELYLPLAVEPGAKPVEIARRWSLPAEMKQALAAYACDFSRPFWAAYQVSGDTRTLKLADGSTVTETLAAAGAGSSYTYNLAGIGGLTSFTATLHVDQQEERCELTWQVSFLCATAETMVQTIGFVAAAAEQMRSALAAHFTPAG